MITIDGQTYDIPVLSLKRSADFLDKYANRTEDGVLHRELIGVYFNYSLTLGSSKRQSSQYAALWDKLTEPAEFHTVVVPYDQTNYTFQAYFSGVSDELRIRGPDGSIWQGLQVKFTAQSPARK